LDTLNESPSKYEGFFSFKKPRNDLHSHPPRHRFGNRSSHIGTTGMGSSDWVAPTIKNWTSIEIGHDKRVISANGVPRHSTGIFPNAGNPNAISAHSYTYSITMQPKMTGDIAPLRGACGVCVNGVPLDPGAGESFH
tara:strand:- start:1945 stop:2355 length:411 start_codon:yes stop_codon:yes gene_type:complete